MSKPMIWEPVRGPAGESEGSNGGNDGSGRSGRRSSSIIARRRPAAKKDAAEETPQAKDSDADNPRTPRRRRADPAGAAAVSTMPEASLEGASAEAKPMPRSRSRKAATEKAPAEGASAEAKPVPRSRSKRAAAERAPEESTTEQTSEEAVAEDAKTPATRSRSRSAPVTGVAAESAELGRMSALLDEQSRTLSELHAGMLVLGAQLDQSAQRARLGVFVDVPNVMYGLEPDEKPLDMGKLLNFLRKGRDLVRATAYSPVSDDPSEPLEQQKFVVPFVRYEYRIVTKPLKRFADGSIKGNFDVEMAIDMVTMADRLDVIAIVSGDADFARAVEVVQTRGVRVEVVAFAGSSSLEMRSLADRYIELGAVIDQVR